MPLLILIILLILLTWVALNHSVLMTDLLLRPPINLACNGNQLAIQIYGLNVLFALGTLLRASPRRRLFVIEPIVQLAVLWVHLDLRELDLLNLKVEVA